VLMALQPAKSNNPAATPAAKKANIANQTLTDALASARNPSLPLLAPLWSVADEAQSRAVDSDPDRPLIVRASSSTPSTRDWSPLDGML
jgi:hypothetical protein